MRLSIPTSDFVEDSDRVFGTAQIGGQRAELIHKMAKRSSPKNLECGDDESIHLPLTLLSAVPSPSSIDPQYGTEDVRGHVPSNVSAGVAHVHLSNSIFQMDWNGIAFSSNSDKNSIQDAWLIEGTEKLSGFTRASRELDHLRAKLVTEFALGVVLGEFSVKAIERLLRFRWAFSHSNCVDAFSNLRNSLPFDALHKDSATALQFHKMNAFLFSDQSGEFCHVFSQARHGKSLRAERIYQEAILKTLLHHNRSPTFVRGRKGIVPKIKLA